MKLLEACDIVLICLPFYIFFFFLLAIVDGGQCAQKHILAFFFVFKFGFYSTIHLSLESKHVKWIGATILKVTFKACSK